MLYSPDKNLMQFIQKNKTKLSDPSDREVSCILRQGNTSENESTGKVSLIPRPSALYEVATDWVTCRYLKWCLMYRRTFVINKKIYNLSLGNLKD